MKTDPDVRAALHWLDEHTDSAPGTAQQAVIDRLTHLDVHELHARSSRRARIEQRSIAAALAAYYPDRTPDQGIYSARYGADQHAETSILTRPDWLDLSTALGTRSDALHLNNTDPGPAVTLDERATEHAIDRLAATLALNSRMVDMPLYRLTSADVRTGTVAGSLGVTPFVQYALTMDLLEGELADALAEGQEVRPSSLPLRHAYLPDVAALTDLGSRLCAGGALALCAIARPARPHQREADYLLLVQERSSLVVNAAHRLAVIPKGFHQPMADYRADARLSATLLRELEEELFGRDDIDNTIGDQRSADPMHPSRLSDPMRWLLDDPSRLRMECTGFGLNLVSGNYEFPGLILIDDEEFWNRYGGDIAANWESQGLRQYSSLDTPLLADLIGDVGWSNEGLFALLQGLRRLVEIGGSRVDLPAIEWEIT